MIYWIIGTAVATALIVWLCYEAKNAPTVIDDTTLYTKPSMAKIKEKNEDAKED